MIADGIVDRTCSVFVALGHALRLRIIDRLASVGSATPNELAEHFGESQQNVSKHLKILAHAGLVSRRKEGSNAIYAVRDDAISRIVDDAAGLVLRGLTELSSSAGLSDEVEASK